MGGPTIAGLGFVGCLTLAVALPLASILVGSALLAAGVIVRIAVVHGDRTDE